MKTPNRRISATSAGVAASTLAIVVSAAAAAQPIVHWDLPGQPLADSLRAVAARTDSNILFDGKLVSGQSAPPLKTQASTDEALAHLLAGTGLTYRHLDEKTFTIQLASAQDSRPPTAVVRPSTAADLPQVAITIEELVVTGTQIRGIENNTAPLIVLSKEYIDATGYGTTTRLIESLPQNFALANQSGANTPGVSGIREQGAAINLRAIGEGTTLVLLNGRRLAPGFMSAAVDISALPLTAIEKVEVLPDGASALYGSDAVGGVVNFILREDFEGAETRLRGGSADGSDEYRAYQALGNAWASGNALLSLEYYKRDLLLKGDRDYVPSTSLIGSLLPEEENYSAAFTGNQQLSESVSLFADALYSQRDSYNRGGRTTFFEDATVDNPQMFGTLGMNWRVAGDWQVQLTGGYGRNDLDITRGGRASATVRNQNSFNWLFESESAGLKVDGTLLTLPGGTMRAALGTDWRSESYVSANILASGAVSQAVDADQIVRSAFAEVYVPLVGEANAVTGVRSLELSLASRYDDYSSFGSSFDPQYGLMWEPVSGLRLRARHGTSYKAPNLTDYGFANNGAAAVFASDPLGTGNPAMSYQLQVNGVDVNNLTAQESESSSFGFEIQPASLEGLAVAVNYYRIKYDNRIAIPSVSLANPTAFSSLFIRNPTADQVNQFIAIGQLGPSGFMAFNADGTINTTFTASQVSVIVDNRKRNLSVVDTNGLDLSAQYDFTAGPGRVALGLSGSYILELEQQLTSTAAAIDRVDTFGNPPDWRLRGYATWRLGGFATNLAVNHTDSYTDTRRTTPVPISSYTTVDARFAYSFGDGFSSSFLSGVTIAANVQNLADEDPPAKAIVSTLTDLGFDSTNASPLGRFVSLELTKAW